MSSPQNLFNRWWRSVDRITVILLLTIITVGVILNFAATPSIAHRLGHDTFYFVRRHMFYLVPTLVILISVSFLNPVQIRKSSLVLLIGFFCLLMVTPIVGVEIKGARRWINLCGMSFQVSEFLKPCFSVISGWLLAKYAMDKNFPGVLISGGILGIIIGCLLLQPDLGMSLIFLSSWCCQLFVAGIPYVWVAGMIASVPVGITAAYFIFPHVARRIHIFFHIGDGINVQGEHYQITRSLEAFMKGGIFGQGPAEGTIKRYVPDAHSELIFAVAGEEFGLLFCLFIIALFLATTYRIVSRIYHCENMFTVITVTGLIARLSMHSLVNMASTLNMIPTKGMTMPFISYGGSSMLALALTCSILLSLTRKQNQMVGL